MKLLKKGLLGLCLLYLVGCTILFFAQEQLLFQPTKLSPDYNFSNDFSSSFQEIKLNTNDNKVLSNLLFQSEEKKGVVLYLHGNGGAINGWGLGADFFTSNGYDILYADYRSYGKSEGKIKSEAQLISDAQLAYDYLKKTYNENQIIVIGTSIGTGIATQLAANNNPSELILNAPYSSLKALIREIVPVVPPVIIKYKLNTLKHLEKVKCPVVIFHGEDDELIKVNHAIKLKGKYAKIDLIVIENYGHNGLSRSEIWKNKMIDILAN